MPEGLDAFKSGQVAMQMNFFAFFPGLYKDPNVGGDKIGFFVNPAEKGTSPSSAARASRSCPTSDNQEDALEYIKWFAQPDVQKKWWALGGYSCRKAVLNDPSFPKSAPFARDFLESMKIVKDFWAEPSYAELLLAMQKRVHDYVVADKGTAKQALDSARQGLDRGLRGRGQDLAASRCVCSPAAFLLAAGEFPSYPEPGAALSRMSEVTSVPTLAERAARATPVRGRTRVRGLSDRAIAWLFITPTIALLLAINIFPLIWTIQLSFTNYRANRPNAPIQWLGLRNYERVLTDPDIWHNMQMTAHFVLWTIAIQTRARFRFGAA